MIVKYVQTVVFMDVAIIPRVLVRCTDGCYLYV